MNLGSRWSVSQDHWLYKPNSTSLAPIHPHPTPILTSNVSWQILKMDDSYNPINGTSSRFRINTCFYESIWIMDLPKFIKSSILSICQETFEVSIGVGWGWMGANDVELGLYSQWSWLTDHRDPLNVSRWACREETLSLKVTKALRYLNKKWIT
jgi:hypothetical protein